MQAPQAGSRALPTWPAVTVYFDGTEYWLADGFHRLLAAQRVGRKNIAADVKQGSREDAAWASCAANQTHGLQRTNADKRKAVVIALGLHPEISAREIAAHCGVNDHLVKDVRVRCGIPAPDRVVGRDGKTYPAPPTPKAKGASGQGVGPPPRSEEKGELEHVPFPPPPAPPPREPEPEPDPKPVDDVGRRIPEHLLELWERRQEVQDMLTAISRVRVGLEKAQEKRDPLFSEVIFSSAILHLKQAYNAVQVTKPYAVCAYCQGHGCKACSNRGLLGKFRWDTTVPVEHKEAVARIIEKEHAA